MEGVGEERNALCRGKEMKGKAARIITFTTSTELLLHPGESFGEQNAGFFCGRTAVFLQFRAQCADWASIAGELFAIFDFDLHEAAKTFPGRFGSIEFSQEFPESRDTQVDDGTADFVFGSKVVVNVTERDAGTMGDVGDGGAAETVSVSSFLGGSHQL